MEYTLQPSPKGGTNLLHEPVPGGVLAFTFTPILRFGNLSTGITYGTNVGTCTKIGRRLNFEISITLTSKGSAVGSANIEGPPFELEGAATLAAAYWANMTTNLVHVVGLTGQGTPLNILIAILGLAAAGTSLLNLQDTDFSNTTTINLSGSYFVSPFSQPIP
jgi:hypothetical protein